MTDPAPKDNLCAERARWESRQEWKYWFLAVVVAAAVIVMAHLLMGLSDGIPAGLLALTLCGSISAGPIYWRRGSFGTRMPVASTLLSITLRMLLMVGALGLVAATKWSHRNSFAGSLLGCYFIFLTLESALSIRDFSSRTPS